MKFEDMINQIITGDCLEVMKDIPDNSIDLIVTSPPYDDLREYKGYSFNFEAIARDLLRIIKQGGVLVWVVGDRMTDGSESGTSFKQALYFKEIGFNLHDTMIYMKNGTAFPNPKRYHQCFEYMFVLVKGEIVTANILKDKYNTQSFKTHSKRWERQKDGSIKLRNKDEYSIDQLGSRWNVWLYDIGFMKSSKEKITFEHPATFPEALAADHIKSWSNEGELILDPFSGSGTTAKMAQELRRKFIGIEQELKYVAIAKERLRILDMQPKLF